MRQSLRKHFVASFAFFVLGQAALPLQQAPAREPRPMPAERFL